MLTAVFSLATTAFVGWLEASGSLPEAVISKSVLAYWCGQAVSVLSATGVVWAALDRVRIAVADVQKSDSRHRLIAESVDDFIWSVNTDFVFTYVSPAVERILGFSPAEVLGEHVDRFRFEPGSLDVGLLVESAVAEGRETLRYEARPLRKDGTPIWCEFNTRIQFDENGRLEGVTGVTRDISERKLAEEKRQELEIQLRQSQKMEAVGQLAGGIAHDFNNYLTVILGNVEMLMRQADTENGPRLAEIGRAARRSAELTQQLLAVSRKQVLLPIVLDLNAVIRDSSRLLRRVLGEDVSIEMNCAEDLGHIQVDPGQLEQVILNLAVNARAAMPEGGELAIETADVFLDSESAERRGEVRPGRYVMLVVSDNGSGMDEETRLQIFEPFFTTKAAGSGLGLSTVQGIVAQSGGAIDVSSAPGEGTTLRIYLPRVDRVIDSPEENLDTAWESEARGSETVLVVEDQPMVRRLVRGMLEAHGFRALTVGDRDEAIAAVESHPGSIDLLLTDIILPGTNGLKLARELEDRFGLRALYMSGFKGSADVDHEIPDPDRQLLRKPFTSKQLLMKVRGALDS